MTRLAALRFWLRHCRYSLWIIAATVLASCDADSPSVFEPQGHGANQIATLGWILFAIAAVVYVAVIGLLLAALFRYRRASPEIQRETPPGSQTFILVSGVAVPAVILGAVFGMTLHTMNQMVPPGQSNPLTIEVIGKQWWWDVRYPDYDVTTANEIHIPAGEPVQIQLNAADVIHSFWVPELHGKIDLIPGQTNTIWIQADEPGEYLGLCSEFCGMQHAHMQFLVIADEPDEFARWLELQQQPAPEPTDALTLRGREIFLGSACVYCHTIEGTNATSDLGPDLTHFASRRTIGAGAVPNTRGHLAGWIIDSQSIKPGNRMPPMYMNSEDLQALLAYMDTLR